ncbi:hydroxyphenylacetyl-CoA thioesterase PaaI [Nisaea acidiphila]|uniref:Hydroxyphenylacetyl-CoA thioesterase PaaI n=1 Tax=Nisaea acidiphila TaxID=1862145 RepID=A0A9J7AV14_9PROT|nr:hydroxyphenylacetyl-CoA thioesterase PaaI [Nisaea acidiphila]UUX50305.1 hydroxyphenylacetyl-CoA thioesterase PaaI [Nisaea acidiphila]
MNDSKPPVTATEPANKTARRVADWMHENDPATRNFGMLIEEVGPGYACLRMTVRPEMLNGHKTCHGGLIFTLADSAFAFACNSGNALTVAQSCDIDFVNPAHEGDELVAICEERFHRGRSGIYDTVVQRADGTVVAHFRGRSRTIGGALVEDGAVG